MGSDAYVKIFPLFLAVLWMAVLLAVVRCDCTSPALVVTFYLQRKAGPGGAELHTCDCRECSQCQHEAVCLQGKGNLFTLCCEFSITVVDIVHK